jgi:O-antigen/teichoic acid export membrane protein
LLRAFLRCAHKQLALFSCLIAVPAGVCILFYPGFADELRWALLLAVATAPVYAVMRLNGGLANARKRFIIANAPELLVRPVFLASLVGAAVVLSLSLDAATIVSINLGIATALAIWMSVVMSRQTGADLLQAKTHEPVAPKQMQQWRTLALPMVLATLFVAMFADLNILMVGSIMTAGETGIFGVSIKITFLMAFAIQIVHQVMLRDASDAHLSKNHQALQATVRKANRFAVAITLSGFVSLILFGNYVLGFFGAGFTEGYAGMIGLMIAQVIRAAAGPAIQILMISGNQRASIPVYIASIALLFACNIVFVPIFGFIGAAAAVIITTLFWTVWLNRIVRREVGIPISVFTRR